MIHDFLPICRADMDKRGWESCDFVYVCGDAYVDHPSFGHAIISRMLEAHGYKVGIIAQPDWKNQKSIQILGEPLPNETEQKELNLEDENFEFLYDIALSPEVNAKMSKREKIPFYTIKVDDEMIDKQIESICKNNGNMIAVDEIEGTEYLKGELIELDADGNVKEGGIKNEDASMSVFHMKDEEAVNAFKGKKVAVQKGTIEEGLAKKQLKDSTVVSLTAMGEAINEVKSGQVDAVDLEKPVAEGYVAQNPDLALASVALKVDDGDAKAVAMAKGNDKLKEAVNKVIKKLKDNGTYDEYIKDASKYTAVE